MKPINRISKTLKTNAILFVGESGADFDLPVLMTETDDGKPCFVSCWRMSLKERLLALFTGKVWLGVLGTAHPPVWVASTPPPWGRMVNTKKEMGE